MCDLVTLIKYSPIFRYTGSKVMRTPLSLFTPNSESNEICVEGEEEGELIFESFKLPL